MIIPHYYNNSDTYLTPIAQSDTIFIASVHSKLITQTNSKMLEDIMESKLF